MVMLLVVSPDMVALHAAAAAAAAAAAVVSLMP
jgi:hypothetical protein